MDNTDSEVYSKRKMTLQQPEMRINKVIVKDKKGNVIEEIENVNNK